MKRSKKTVSCAIAAAISLSAFAGLPGMPKLGPLGADVVSAATGETTAPAKPAPAKPTTTKPSTSTKTTSTKTTSTKTTTTPKTQVTTQTSAKINRILKLGSKGSEVNALQTLLNNNGYNLKVDGVFGKKTLAAVKDFQKENGLAADGKVGPKTLAVLSPVVVAPVVTKPATPPVVKVEKVNVKLGKAEYAAHGTKCYTVAVVAMAGDKIADAYIDDYQFMPVASVKAVPNSDKDFGTANYKDPANSVLASKRLNADYYSKNMKEKGGATQTVDQNFGAVQTFVKGKTIAELEAIIKTNPTDAKVDAVSGATLADTNGYLNAIVSAAKAANNNNAFEIDATQVSSLKVAKAEYAAHGTKCFTVASVAVLGEKIVGTYIDDYQFMPVASVKAVPNSDKDFGTANYKDPANSVLASKRLNAEYYSKNMKEKGGATLTVDQNFGAVQAFVTGKTIAELESVIKTNPTDPKVDAVSGATLADTNGYLNAVLTAAKTLAPKPDVVTTASIVNSNKAFVNAISKTGTWIIATLNDMVIDKPITLDGEFKNGKKNADGTDAIQRKIGLYTQDENHKVTGRFTLTAPKITINSPNASIEHGKFKGDVYVSGKNFKLVNQIIDGSIYFLNEDAQKTFTIADKADDVKTTITGKQELKKN